ncbi:hypothetical protein [Dyella sp.]|uniref:hypothetical protein n=1 Tax=Dyella sp. TaxID=1869338 RepID=UPI002B49B7EF|nr:hypothetical protein [Dyella sp.]HKT27369.1 hypothetical protein [Dyella sp.]
MRDAAIPVASGVPSSRPPRGDECSCKVCSTFQLKDGANQEHQCSFKKIAGSHDSVATYTSMAASVDTQIATQAAKKLLSIKVSNFMAVLHPISD